jgi:triosephosphate isomerase
MSNKILIANWKMNLNVKQSIDFIKQLKSKLKKIKLKNKVVICPSFTALEGAGQALKGSKIALGAQNVAQAKCGTWTGEVSIQMLKEVGCKYVIVGHSERRQNLAETDEQINAKVRLVLEHQLTPILCVGETRQERKRGLTNRIIARQVKKGLEEVKLIQNSKFKIQNSIIIAYEPIWAISDGKHPAQIPTVKEIEKVHKLIFNILNKKYSAAIVKKSCQLIYGGSVNSKNIAELFSSDYIQGGLIGGASLKVGEFSKMIKLG